MLKCLNENRFDFVLVSYANMMNERKKQKRPKKKYAIKLIAGIQL